MAGLGPSLSQIALRPTDGDARGSDHISPCVTAGNVLAGVNVFRVHEAPVAFELLGYEHGKRCEVALSHLRSGNPDDRRVVRFDHDPGRYFRITPLRFVLGLSRLDCDG